MRQPKTVQGLGQIVHTHTRTHLHTHTHTHTHTDKHPHVLAKGISMAAVIVLDKSRGERRGSQVLVISLICMSI